MKFNLIYYSNFLKEDIFVKGIQLFKKKIIAIINYINYVINWQWKKAILQKNAKFCEI